MQLIDSHCHFDDPRFDEDRSHVYQVAIDQGVSHIISPSVTAASWEGLASLCNRYPGVLPAFGLHPMFMRQHQLTHIPLLDQFLKKNPAVAVGECGLDFYKGKEDEALQCQLFEEQIELAVKYNLPIIIHARKAVEQVINILKNHPQAQGVLHSFSGSSEQAFKLIDRGYYTGFGGPLTWVNSNRLKKVFKSLPLDAILLETDAPDQADEKHRGERNEPAWAHDILVSMAEIREEPLETIALSTTNNAKTLFRITTS